MAAFMAWHRLQRLKSACLPLDLTTTKLLSSVVGRPQVPQGGNATTNCSASAPLSPCAASGPATEAGVPGTLPAGVCESGCAERSSADMAAGRGEAFHLAEEAMPSSQKSLATATHGAIPDFQSMDKRL